MKAESTIKPQSFLSKGHQQKLKAHLYTPPKDKDKHLTDSPFTLADNSFHRYLLAKHGNYGTGSNWSVSRLTFLRRQGQGNIDVSVKLPVFVTSLFPAFHTTGIDRRDFRRQDINSNQIDIHIMDGPSPWDPDFVSMLFTALFTRQYQVPNLGQILNKTLSYSASPMELVMHNIASRLVANSTLQFPNSPYFTSQYVETLHHHYLNSHFFYRTLSAKISPGDLFKTGNTKWAIQPLLVKQPEVFTSWFPHFSRLSLHTIRHSANVVQHYPILRQILSVNTLEYLNRLTTPEIQNIIQSTHVSNTHRWFSTIESINQLNQLLPVPYPFRQNHYHLPVHPSESGYITNITNVTPIDATSRYFYSHDDIRKVFNLIRKVYRVQNDSYTYSHLHRQMDYLQPLVKSGVQRLFQQNRRFLVLPGSEPQIHQIHMPLLLRDIPHDSPHKTAGPFPSKQNALIVSELFSALFSSSYSTSNLKSFAYKRTLSYTASPMEILMHGITTRVLEESHATQERLHEQDRKRNASGTIQFLIPSDRWLSLSMNVLSNSQRHDGSPQNQALQSWFRQNSVESPKMTHHTASGSNVTPDTIKQIQKTITNQTKQLQSRVEKQLNSSAAPMQAGQMNHLADSVYSLIRDRLKRERSMRGY